MTARARLYMCVALVACLLLALLCADLICPFDPQAQDLSQALLPPGGDHLLGTDRYGRDVLARVLAGGRTSVGATLLLVALVAVCGTALGVCGGLAGGRTDVVLMGAADLCLAFPGMVLAMALAAMLRGGMTGAVVALAAVSWPKYARLARSRTLALKNAAFIHAARLAGDTPLQLVWRHLLPNLLGIMLITAMLDIGTMLMELAGLSFLGLGAQPPTAEWGNMMSSDRGLLQLCPWVLLGPGAGIFLTVVLFNLLGDAVRDYWDVS